MLVAIAEEWESHSNPKFAFKGFFMLLRVLICAVGVAVTGAVCGLGQSTEPLPGERKWEFLTDSAVVGCPALGTNGLLYAATQGGHVFALDATNGQLQWDTNFGGSIYSSPVCHVGPEGTLYVSRNDTLYAFDGETGEEKWIQAFEGYYDYTPTRTIGSDETPPRCGNCSNQFMPEQPFRERHRIRYSTRWPSL